MEQKLHILDTLYEAGAPLSMVGLYIRLGRKLFLASLALRLQEMVGDGLIEYSVDGARFKIIQPGLRMLDDYFPLQGANDSDEPVWSDGDTSRERYNSIMGRR